MQGYHFKDSWHVTKIGEYKKCYRISQIDLLNFLRLFLLIRTSIFIPILPHRFYSISCVSAISAERIKFTAQCGCGIAETVAYCRFESAAISAIQVCAIGSMMRSITMHGSMNKSLSPSFSPPSTSGQCPPRVFTILQKTFQMNIGNLEFVMRYITMKMAVITPRPRECHLATRIGGNRPI